MKTNLSKLSPEPNPELIIAAPLAVSGALGAEFWDEVARLDSLWDEKVDVEPRPGTDY